MSGRGGSRRRTAHAHLRGHCFDDALGSALTTLGDADLGRAVEIDGSVRCGWETGSSAGSPRWRQAIWGRFDAAASTTAAARGHSRPAAFWDRLSKP